MQNLRDQNDLVESKPTFADHIDSKPALLPDLSETIANVRKEYEAFNARSLEDLDRFYKEKVRFHEVFSYLYCLSSLSILVQKIVIFLILINQLHC